LTANAFNVWFWAILINFKPKNCVFRLILEVDMLLSMRFRWLVFILFSCPFSILAATITSTGAGGDWNVGGSWVGGVAPAATDDVIIASGATINVTTNQTCATLTINGTGILNFPTNTRTLTVTGTMTMNGNSQVTGNNNSRILSLQGDFNIPSGQAASIGGVRVTQAITGTFNLAGTFTPTDNTGTKTFGNANFYDGCLIDASVTEGINIAGNLSVLPATPGQHARVGRVSMTVTGTTLVTGYLEFANSGVGTKTFNNTITVAAGGTWDNIIGEDPVINCSIVNNGVWPQPTGGNGRYDVNVSGTYTYTGSKQIAFTRLRIQTNAVVTNNTSLLLSKTNNSALTVDVGGTFINGDGIIAAVLTFTGYTDVVNLGGGGSSVDFDNTGNTVVYAGLADQNVYPTTYHHLTCSSNLTASVNGATVVNGTLTISGSTIVDVTGGTDLNGPGDLVMTGTSTLRLSSAGTVPALTGTGHSLDPFTIIEFYRAGAQTAASSASYPYQNVVISGNAGSAVNFNAVSSIAGYLDITNSGTFTNTAGTPPLMTVGSDITYRSAATTTLNTNLNAGSVLLESGGFTFSNQTITINGDNGFWAVIGAPTITQAGTAQVVFTTGVNQQIGGTTAPTFNRLVINNSNDVTLFVTPVTISGTLTLTDGRLITGSNTVVIASGGSVSRTNGFIEGNLNKAFVLGTSTQTFEVGTNADYTPVFVTCTSVTTAGTLTVASVEGDHPDIFSGLIEPSNTVNRYWSMTNVGIAFSAFSAGQIAATVNWVNGDEDALLDNTAIVKWYNNTSLSWTGFDQFDEVAEQNPVMTNAMNIATNSLAFTALNPAQLPSGDRVDFQVGEKIDPTFVYNRLTGANNWNNLATWIQQRSGVITLTNGSATITGASTNFQGELSVGDNIMLITSPGTVYTVATIDPVLQSLTVAPVPVVSTSGGYGRQYIPGVNSPASDVDAVVIGNTNIADAATTITLDTDAQILTLTIGSTARTTAQVLTHQNSTRDLVVLANATVSQPGGAATNTWNINDGTADVQGDVTIGSAANNTNTRISRINITTGTLGAGSLRFRPFNQNGREVQTVMNISGAGTVNLHGALTFNGNRGTLSSAAGSTFNFDRSSSGQTIAVPSSSTAAWVYANIHANNTSTAGVAFGFTSTATSVTGNVRVQTGLMTVGNFNIVGAAGSTFQAADGATFEMRSTSGGGNGGFPTGFGTVTLGASSTVAYNQNLNTNPWPVLPHTYGHLIIGQNGSDRNFELANAATSVAGNLTVGSGTSTPTLRATGTATLNVAGNVTINASADLDASNITNFNVGGDWTNDGDFTEGTNTVTFDSPAANVLQTLGGTVSETFYNLRLNTSATTDVVRLTNSISVLNNLILTQGGLELNGNTLSVGNSATTAISRTTGFIKSESATAPYGTLRWFINNGTGTYTYPFGVSASQYIPFVMNITVAGTRGIGSGYVPVSTYATAATNPPGEYPTGVTNLNGTSGGASVTDRYWNITLGSSEYAGTRPTSTITFTALNTEKPTTWTAIGEPPTNPNQLVAQRWNTAAYWDPAQTSPAQTYSNDAPAVGTFQVGVPSVSSYSTSWTITDSSVPLPVELVSFTAEFKEDRVEVIWATESEIDNDFFTVQRTMNGEQFEDVVNVKGNGTTAATHRYSAADTQLLPGRWYYRIRQTDYDGSHSYSRLVAVDVPESLFRTIYPNPGNGQEVNLSLPAGDIGKTAMVVVVDAQGRVVYQTVPFGIDRQTIRLVPSEPLTPGTYLMSVAVETQVRRYKWVVR
jgi:hypothetical protein